MVLEAPITQENLLGTMKNKITSQIPQRLELGLLILISWLSDKTEALVLFTTNSFFNW